MSSSNLKVLFYVPNLIDYFRLILIVIGWIYINDEPKIFLTCYITQIFLDFFDGYFARLLNQVSTFGAWLDVVLDNLGRGILWCHLFKVRRKFISNNSNYNVIDFQIIYKYGFFISCIEWIAFSITQNHGSSWKEWFLKETPFLVRQIFKNNFKTITGFTAIAAGLQGLPVWLYLMSMFNGSVANNMEWWMWMITIYCILGRSLCMSVELWLIYKNIIKMISDDIKQKN